MVPWLNMRLMPSFQRLIAMSSLRSDTRSDNTGKSKLIGKGINMTTDTARAEISIQARALRIISSFYNTS